MKKDTYKILRDAPTEKDAFSGGGHERSANALSTSIKQLDEIDAVIGLDGAWGSGKSSIIKMSKAQLNKSDQTDNKKYLFMTFDLWANQSLPFRRAFLEKFIEWAQTETKPSKKVREYLEEKARQIGGKEELIETSTDVHFNALGAIMVLLLPIMPLAYVWLSPFAVKAKVQECVADCTGYAGIQAWLISNASFIMLLFFISIYVAILIRFISLCWEHGNFLTALKKVAGLIERKSEGYRDRKLIRDVDPSTTEFSKTFREILAKLQTDTKRVVCIFDNIDRLQADRVAIVWSDVQAVLERDNDAKIEQVLSAIIPYDRNVIRDALDANVQKRNTANHDDLFRKSFDIIHHVALPVVSDISAFLKSKLSEAMPEQIDTDTLNRVSRIFDYHLGESNSTPRQITAFVNELGSVWFEWNQEIPIDVVSIFVLNRESLETTRSTAAISKITQSEFSNRTKANKQELEEWLAMLIFSAPKEQAMQIALLEPISRELKRHNSSRLVKELRQAEAFEHMLGRVVSTQALPMAKELNDYDHALENLSSLGIEHDFVQEAVNTMVSQVAHLKAAHWEDIPVYEGVLSLPTLVRKEERLTTIQFIVQWAENSLQTVSEREEDAGQCWIDAIDKMREALIAAGITQEEWLDIQKTIHLPKGAKFICGTAIKAGDHGIEISKFNTQGRAAGLVDQLGAEIESASINLPTIVEQIMPLIKTSAKKLMQQVGKTLDTIESQNFDAQNRLALIKSYVALARARGWKNSQNDLETLKNDGAIFQHISTLLQTEELSETGWTDTIAELVILLVLALDSIEVNPNTLQSHPRLGNIAAAANWFNTNVLKHALTEVELTRVIAAVKRQAVDYMYVFRSGNAENQPPIVSQIGVALLHEPPGVQLVQKDFLNRVDKLMELSTEGVVKYASVLDKSHPDWENVDPLSVSLSFVMSISTEDQQHCPNFLKKLDAALIDRSADFWSDDFSNDTTVLTLLENRLLHGGLNIPVAKIKGPIIEHLVNVLTMGTKPVRELSTIVDALPTTSRKSAHKDFLERLTGKPVDAENIMNLVSEYPSLLQEMAYEVAPSPAFEKILMPMLENLNEDFVKLIKTKSDVFKRVIEQVGENGFERVKEVLVSVQSGEFNLQELGNVLGVEIGKKDNESEVDISGQ